MNSNVGTVTFASAELRTKVIVSQINFILRETTGATTALDLLEKGMLENQWISSVRVLALDGSDRIWGAIEMTMDWQRHQINLHRHGQYVQYDHSLPEGERVHWAIGNMVKFFNDLKTASQLRAVWEIYYVEKIQNDDKERARVNTNLGLVSTPERKWVNECAQDVLVINPDHLNEIRVGLKVVDNPSPTTTRPSWVSKLKDMAGRILK